MNRPRLSLLAGWVLVSVAVACGADSSEPGSLSDAHDPSPDASESGDGAPAGDASHPLGDASDAEAATLSDAAGGSDDGASDADASDLDASDLDVATGPPTLAAVTIDGYGASHQVAFGAGTVTLHLAGTGLDKLTGVTAGAMTAALVAGGTSTARAVTLTVGHAAPGGLAAGNVDLKVTSPAGSATLANALTVTAITVTASGSDATGHATPDAPLRTVTKALKRAADRDDVTVGAGLYDDAAGEVWIDRSSGPIAANVREGITVTGAGPTPAGTRLVTSLPNRVALAIDATSAAAVLTYVTGLSASGFSTALSIANTKNDVTVTDVGVTGGANAIEIDSAGDPSASNLNFYRTTVSGCSGSGLYAHGTARVQFTGDVSGCKAGVLAIDTAAVSVDGTVTNNGTSCPGGGAGCLQAYLAGIGVLGAASVNFRGTMSGNGCNAFYVATTGHVGVTAMSGGALSQLVNNGASCHSSDGGPFPLPGAILINGGAPSVTITKTRFANDVAYGLGWLSGSPTIAIDDAVFEQTYSGIAVDSPCGTGSLAVRSSTFTNNTSAGIAISQCGGTAINLGTAGAKGTSSLSGNAVDLKVGPGLAITSCGNKIEGVVPSGTATTTNLPSWQVGAGSTLAFCI